MISQIVSLLKLPDGPVLDLALRTHAHLEALGWDLGFVQKADPADGVWQIGGLWRVEVGPDSAQVLGWNWGKQRWLPERLSFDPEAEERFPLLGWRSVTQEQAWAGQFVRVAVEECHVEALNDLEGATGNHLLAADSQKALSAVMELWCGPNGLMFKRGFPAQVRRWKKEVEAHLGVGFVRQVCRLRCGRPFTLGHLLSAWPHRQALDQVARSHPQWLPLLNVLGLSHWASEGWREPAGWAMSRARLDEDEDRWVLPWEKGPRWEPTDLPVFIGPAQAKAWLERKAVQADPSVWRSSTDVYLYEKGLERWVKEPWWPGKLPATAQAALQRVHSELTDRLVDPPIEVQMAAMVRGWVLRWQALSGQRSRYPKLAREWDDLVEGMDLLKEQNRLPVGWSQLWELPLRHPWVARDRSGHLAGALAAVPESETQSLVGTGRARL